MGVPARVPAAGGNARRKCTLSMSVTAANSASTMPAQSAAGSRATFTQLARRFGLTLMRQPYQAKASNMA